MDVRRPSRLASAGSNWLAFAAALAVSFLLTPYLIRTLGPPRYDVWCVAESVVAYFTLLDFGIAAVLVRQVARLTATRDQSALNRMASACLAVYTAAAGVALLVGVPLAVALGPKLDAKAGTADAAGFLVLMLATVAATLPLSVFGCVLDGLEKYPAKSAVKVLFLLLRTTGIVWAVTTFDGLVPLAVVTLATTLGEQAVLIALCFRSLPGLRLGPSLIDRDTLRLVRGASVDAFLAMLAGRITYQTGAILVGFLLAPGSATAFATAARLVEQAKLLLRTITATLTPGVSAMEARGDWAGIRGLFLTATRWLLYLVLPVNLGLWLFGRPFLTRWVGPEVAAGCFPAVVVLAFTLTVGIAQSVASRLLYGLGRLRLFARLALAEAGLNLLLAVPLVLGFGVTGMAVAVAVPNVLFCVAVIGWTCRVTGVGVAEYAAAWATPVVASLVPLGVWLMIGDVEATWPGVFGGIAVGLVPYAAIVGGIELVKRKTPSGGRWAVWSARTAPAKVL